MASRQGRSSSPRVTLSQVAELAGVSTTAVSVILSGRKAGLKQFHPDTIARVRRSADRLGYRANLFASSIATRDSAFFGLIIEDLAQDDPTQWHLWAFEGELLSGVITSAVGAGLYPVIASAAQVEDDHEIRSIVKLMAGGVFGTIARTPNEAVARHLRFRLKQGHPVVVVFPRHVSRWPTNAIDLDNRKVGETAARLLMQQNRDRWAVIHYRRRSQAHRRRCEGFESVAEEAGIPVKRIVLPMEIDDQQIGRLMAERLKRMNVSGAFAVDSVSSVGTMLGGLCAGRELGRDLWLVGCDSSRWQNANLPRITSVDISWRRVGEFALNTLCRLAKSGPARFDTLSLPPMVAPGDTCDVAEEFTGELEWEVSRG